VSWTPDKSVKLGTYTATVKWDLGALGKVTASKKIKVDRKYKPIQDRDIDIPAPATMSK
jgi:hypothetical protein